MPGRHHGGVGEVDRDRVAACDGVGADLDSNGKPHLVVGIPPRFIGRGRGREQQRPDQAKEQ